MITGTPVEIKLKFGDLEPVRHWCERNCTGTWYFLCSDSAGDTPGNYTFYFESPEDLTKFKIWQL